MKYFLSLLLIALICIPYATPAAPSSNESEQFIQGGWRLTGSDGKHSWFLEWTFDKGKFNLKGYPPLYQEGSYRIIKTDGAKLTLELYEQKGNFGTENSQIEVIIIKEKDTLMIKDQGPFTRIKP